MELLGFPGLTDDEEQTVRKLLAHFLVLIVQADWFTLNLAILVIAGRR